MIVPMQAPHVSREVVLNVLCNLELLLCFINGISFKQGLEPVLYADHNKRPPQPIQHPQGIHTSIEASGTCTGSPNTCQTFETTLNLNSNGKVVLDIVLSPDACANFNFTVFMDNQTMASGVSISPGIGTPEWIGFPNQLTQGAHTIRLQPSPPDCATSWNATLRWFLAIEGTNVIQVNGNDRVQVVLNNLGLLPHPFHIHGHRLHMLGYGAPNAGLYNPQRDSSTLLLNSPPRRDTFQVDSASWVVFRFVPNSPGAWALHCHIQLHLSTGLAIVFNVDPDQVPNPPVTVFANNGSTSHGSRSRGGSPPSRGSSSSSYGGSPPTRGSSP